MAIIFYYVILVITSTVMSLSGYDFGTWQWWVISLCVIGSNIAGRERERK